MKFKQIAKEPNHEYLIEHHYDFTRSLMIFTKYLA